MASRNFPILCHSTELQQLAKVCMLNSQVGRHQGRLLGGLLNSYSPRGSKQENREQRVMGYGLRLTRQVAVLDKRIRSHKQQLKQMSVVNILLSPQTSFSITVSQPWHYLLSIWYCKKKKERKKKRPLAPENCAGFSRETKLKQLMDDLLSDLGLLKTKTKKTGLPWVSHLSAHPTGNWLVFQACLAPVACAYWLTKYHACTHLRWFL